MNGNSQDSANDVPEQQPKPKVGETCWVQCKSYRTLAVMNADGKWRAVHDNKEVTEVVSFCPV